jgi:CHASE1-domain containing sensor protein
MPLPILPISTVRVTIALALAYAVLGGAGLMLGSPPSFASPIFPAAGLALAVVLVYGLRAVPGVALGDFSLMLAYAGLNGGFNETSLAVAALGAAGAAARAWAGYWFIRRWQGENWRLMERERDIALFLVLGGLVSALVAASISVPGLLLLHVIAPAEVPYTWWTWYIGDALGIMLFAPLSLCFLLAQNDIWRDRRRRIVLPTLLALSIFSAISYTAIEWQKHNTSDHLNADGNVIAARISDRLTRHREILVSLRNFVEATPALTFDKFQQFTSYGLQENAEISAFSLNDMVTAGARPQLGPVRFVVPLIIHHAVVGHDYFSEPVRRQAIDSAMVSRSLSMTAPIPQLDEVGQRLVVNAFYPFYSINDANNPGWREAKGFVGEVIYLDAMINDATRGVVNHDLVIQLRDVTDPLKKTIFYQTGKPGNDFTTFSASDVAWTNTFAAANRQWELALVPNKAFDAQLRPWGAWALGAAGLFSA